MPHSSPKRQNVSLLQKLGSQVPTVQRASSSGVVPVQAQDTSPQRQLVPAQSPSRRQPGTQVLRLPSQTCPSSHWMSDVQRPFGTHWPLPVSQ